MNHLSIDSDRYGVLDYSVTWGDTWAPLPVWFAIDGVAEDFSGASLKMQFRLREALIKTLTDGGGITINAPDADGTPITWVLSATDSSTLFAPGQYNWDLQKTVGSIVVTILKGTLTIKTQTTT